MNIPAWQPDALEGALVLMLCTLGFTAYHFLSISPQIRSHYEQKFGPEKGQIRHVLFQRYTGMISIGLIPAIILMLVTGKGLSDYGVSTQNLLSSLAWIGGLGSIILIINYFNTQNPKNLAFYPMIRAKEWDTKLVLSNALSWMGYLVGYELMFRGYCCLVLFLYWVFGQRLQ